MWFIDYVDDLPLLYGSCRLSGVAVREGGFIPCSIRLLTIDDFPSLSGLMKISLCYQASNILTEAFKCHR